MHGFHLHPPVYYLMHEFSESDKTDMLWIHGKPSQAKPRHYIAEMI